MPVGIMQPLIGAGIGNIDEALHLFFPTSKADPQNLEQVTYVVAKCIWVTHAMQSRVVSYA